MNGDEHRLFTDIAIILGASFPMLYFGRLLKLPEVIAYLFTGVVIGPHALGLIRATEQVETTAEVGVALILFFIGLHVPVQRLREMGKTTFVSGFLQMALTVAGILAVTLPLGFTVRSGAFFGIMIALGSTAVVLPILSARDEMGSPFAQRFLAVSLFQDFAVIPLILLVPAFASGAYAIPATSIAIRLAIAIAGVIFLVLAGRVVAPHLLARIAALRSREVFTAGALVLIVGTIALAQRLGVSAALGAFAAGVIVGDTEFIHEVGGILRPFRDFLSAIFFVSIGMLLQPAFLLEHLTAVLGVVLVVITVKVLAAYPSFRAAGAIERTSIRAAFAVAPVGEFSFLIAQEAKRFAILGPQEEQMFTAVAVLTLAMTPLLVAVGGRTAAQMRSARTEQQPERRARKRHILVVGYGLNGQNVARVLNAMRVSHVVVEEDFHRGDIARQAGSEVVVADAADVDALLEAGIQDALAVVVAISDPDGTRRIVRACRRANRDVHILVRTRYVSEVERLRDLGANEIIPEEFETSIEIVTRLLRVLAVPGNVVAAQLRVLRDEGYRMLRDPSARTAEGRRLSAILAAGTAQTFLVLPDTPADGATITELGIADDHVVVPALLRDDKPISPAPPDLKLQAGDTLFLVGAHQDLMRVVDKLEAEGGTTTDS